MGKSSPDCWGEGPADRHQAIVGQADEKPLPFRPQAGDRFFGDPPTAMDLRSKLRIEQGYRIGHSHQYEGTPSERMHAKIVILRFESDYLTADLRRQSC